MSDPPRRSCGILLNLAKAVLGVGILVILVRSGLLDPESVLESLRDRPGWTVALITAHALMLVLVGLRWAIVARGAFGPALGWGVAQRLCLASHFFSTILPGNGAGDLVKMWIARSRGFSLPVVVGTVALDRMAGMAGLMGGWTLSMTAIVTLQRPDLAVLLIPFMVLSSTGFLLLAFLLLWGPVLATRFPARPVPAENAGVSDRVYNALSRMAQGVALAGSSRRRILLLIGISVGVQLSFYLYALIAARILGLDLGLLEIGTGLPFVALANAIPLSPGGLGIGEVVASQVFGQLGTTAAQGATLMVTLRIGMIAWAFPGALAAWTLYRSR